MAGKRKAAEDYKVDEILKTLDRSGATKYFFNIKRRVPGKHIFPYWKRSLPVESIEDIRAFCYDNGGEEYDYKVEVRDGDGKPVSNIPDTVIEAGKPMDEINPNNDAALRSPMGDALKQRQQDLLLQRQELILQQQEAALDKERKRLEKQKKGEDPDDDEEDDGIPMHYPYHPAMMGMGMPGGYNPYTPWWMQQHQQNQQPKQNDMVELAKAFASMGQQKDSSLELLKVLIPLLMGNNKALDPKDMIGMFSPFVLEMSKASSEANKLVMQSLADTDANFRERMLEIIMADPNRDADEVEKYRRWLGLGMEVVKDAGGVIKDTFFSRWGRGKEKEVEVPKVGQDKGKPGLPAPKKEEPKDAKPAENPPPVAAPHDPVASAKEIMMNRVKGFVLGMEQEALIGSDVDIVIEKMEELYLLLPKKLRQKIEQSDTAVIFDTLAEAVPDEVKRILAAVTEDQSGELKEWYEEFWETLKTPPEGEDEDDGEEEDEGDPEPEPPEDPGPEEKEPEKEPVQ